MTSIEKIEHIIKLLGLDASAFSSVVMNKGEGYFRQVRYNSKLKPLTENLVLNICRKVKTYIKLKTGIYQLHRLSGDFGEVYKLIKELENDKYN
ncbi:MAG: hypothetical protein ACRC5T_11055 [Cetobacterium sp.]